MLGISLALGGCAGWPGRTGAVDYVEFLSQALAADARGREALWKAAPTDDGSDDAQLRIAVLQSLPNHSGYDPDAARERLERLTARVPGSVQVSSIARLRLAQLGESGECRTEVTELKQRLARVVDIEKRMNRNGR